MIDPRERRLRSSFRSYSYRFSILFVVTLAIAVLLLGRAETYIFDSTQRFLTDITAPVVELAGRPIVGIRNWASSIGDLFNTKEENVRLRKEIALLHEWRSAALELERKVSRYEALLNLKLDPEMNWVSGRVVADTSGPFVNTLIVNAGRQDGVRKGQAVVGSQGLIGRIVEVGNRASRVLLLTDLNSRIPVLIVPSHYRAILAGNNSAEPGVEFLPTTAQLSPGDQVITSGHGGMLPPGLPVGVVIANGSGGHSVQPYATFDRVDYVRILQFDFPTSLDGEEISDVVKKNDSGDPT